MSDSKQPHVLIYTDGACSGNPGPGGWGALLSWNGRTRKISGGVRETTNNRMEMRAVIEALKTLKRPCKVEIRSDSALIVNAFQQGWIENWKRKSWKKANNKPVENRDLWMEMLEAMNSHTVKWTKVKGHADDEYNNLVDRLAVEASKKYS